MRPVRVSVKAIIVRDGKLLVLENRDARAHWYTLPGGGQEHGETMPEALRRECREEIGAAVTVGRLLFVRDYIGAHHQFAATEGDIHQVELMFEARLENEPTLGSVPDSAQIGLTWLDLQAAGDVDLCPRALVEALRAGRRGEAVYLGDVN
jgi:8-oxo-dGTP diphosphatase